MDEFQINRHSDCFNPKNGFANMPAEYMGHFFNGGSEYDMLSGPCSCGAWHTQEEWPEQLQLEVFGFISEKESGTKRRYQ